MMAAIARALTGKASSTVDELGRIFGLMFAVLVRIPRRPWRPRAVAEQVWFVASVTLFPALLLTLSFGLVIGLQVYNITRQFGAESAQGAAMVLAIVREAGPLGTTFMRSEEHTSELQSLMRNSYAVFCLKKKKAK